MKHGKAKGIHFLKELYPNPQVFMLFLKSNFVFLGLKDKYCMVSNSTNDSFEAESFFQYRTYSDSYNGPPNGKQTIRRNKHLDKKIISGTRIVLGREKSPTPDLPHQVLCQYNGKTREVS